MRPIQRRFCSSRAADRDRVAAQEGGEHGGGDAEVDGGHPLAHAVDVHRRAAHAAVLLGDEQELDAEVLAAHAAHELLGELVALVELDQQRVWQLAARELADRLERELEGFQIQTGRHRSPRGRPGTHMLRAGRSRVIVAASGSAPVGCTDARPASRAVRFPRVRGAHPRARRPGRRDGRGAAVSSSPHRAPIAGVAVAMAAGAAPEP